MIVSCPTHSHSPLLPILNITFAPVRILHSFLHTVTSSPRLYSSLNRHGSLTQLHQVPGCIVHSITHYFIQEAPNQLNLFLIITMLTASKPNNSLRSVFSLCGNPHIHLITLIAFPSNLTPCSTSTATFYCHKLNNFLHNVYSIYFTFQFSQNPIPHQYSQQCHYCSITFAFSMYNEQLIYLRFLAVPHHQYLVLHYCQPYPQLIHLIYTNDELTLYKIPLTPLHCFCDV